MESQSSKGSPIRSSSERKAFGRDGDESSESRELRRGHEGNAHEAVWFDRGAISMGREEIVELSELWDP